jgi:hypothetical protein
VTLKQLQARRDLLQNLASQAQNTERDLATVEAAIAEHEAALPLLVAERKTLNEKLTAIAAAKAELPALKRELAEALEAQEKRRSTVTAK